MKFKICNPDANTFADKVKIKPLEELEYEYTSLGSDGYWTVYDPFYDNGFELIRDVIQSFPIQKDNSREDNKDPNPFDTIHIPTWASAPVCFLVRDFYIKYITGNLVEPNLMEWGNVYFKDRTKPIIAHRLPHIDNHDGMVGNLWFTDHKDGGTDLFKFHGKMINGHYDFMVDYNHRLHPNYETMMKQGRANEWFNFSYDELKRWGFEHLGRAPARENTITIYKASTCHSAYIDTNTDFRWSHTFAFANNRSIHAS